MRAEKLLERHVDGAADAAGLPFAALTDVHHDGLPAAEPLERLLGPHAGNAREETHCQAPTTRSTTAASRARTSAAMGASSSLPTIESIRSASTAATWVSPSRT